LVDEVAEPDDVESGAAQEAHHPVAPVRPEVHRVEGDLLDAECLARLDKAQAGHVERGLVLLAELGGEAADVVGVGAPGVDPVGADLSDDIGAAVGHAVHHLFEQVQVVGPLGELVGIAGQVQEAPVHADRLGSDPQEVGGRCVEVHRRRREAHLVREELQLGVRPPGHESRLRLVERSCP